MITLREKRIGPYTVRELPMRETLRVMREFPAESVERGAALLGAAVFNGSGTPMGLAVLDIGTGTYQALMDAYNEVNGRIEFAEDAEGNA